MSFGTTQHPTDVIWTTPSADSSGSMPLGNGSSAVNVWVEPQGDLCLYLARTDSWGEFGQLYKVGRVRISLTSDGGNPILIGGNFRWHLRLQSGSIEISSSNGKVEIWADAHHPVIHVLAQGPASLTGRIQLELWRREQRELQGKEAHKLHERAPYSVYHTADENPDTPGSQLIWWHHNAQSSWRTGLEQQGLATFAEHAADPLLHRTFGGWIQGRQLRKTAAHELVSERPSSTFATSIVLHTAVVDDPQLWVQEIRAVAKQIPRAEDTLARQAHAAWWEQFWQRSKLELNGSEAARKVSRGYALQRFMNACAGRGEFPIKFNGSLFTADWYLPGESYDADYRRWGPGYWHQNTRLPYWSMLYAGDFDLIRPYFEMYRKALPLACERCRLYCGHEGAFFPETMYFWGAYLEGDYGWPDEREERLPRHLPQNQYIRYHHSSGLEVVYHAMRFYRYTGDEQFLETTALPLAEAIIAYYDLHFPRKNGRLHLAPAQVIEQWWSAENPLPEIAGLTACLRELTSLPKGISSHQRDWERLLNELPPLPTRELKGKRVFAPAEKWEGPPQNSENPELYAVFPYHLCGIQSDDVAIGRESFLQRTYWHDQGWAQDGMQAALLGLTEHARRSVVNRLSTPSAYARFPAFWGPGFDWIPDQDQGGSAAHALQLMALQTNGAHASPLAAWPEDWSLEGHLHAPGGQIVTLRHEGRAASL